MFSSEKKRDIMNRKLRGFIANIRRVYNIELHIARERDKLATHFKKWEKMVTFFEQF